MTTARALLAQPEAPIDMVLHCPKCGLQHVDAPDPNQQWGSLEWSTSGAWENPPHRSHLCHGCGHIWRPADVPTNGVQSVKTKGKNDSPVAAAQPEAQGTEPAGPQDMAVYDAIAANYAAQQPPAQLLTEDELPLLPRPDVIDPGRFGVAWGDVKVVQYAKEYAMLLLRKNGLEVPRDAAIDAMKDKP